MTINLKNRKEIDLALITKAVQHKARTFTDLLHMTKLPRKTLSLRLKEMCSDGTIIKKDGVYRLNRLFKTQEKSNFSANRFSDILHDKRMKAGLMMIALLISFPVAAQALAFLFVPPAPLQTQEPVISGNFTMVLAVQNVTDLYAWQVVITFNSNELEVMKIASGDFVEVRFPFFVNATDVGEGVLLLGGTLCGTVPGKNGSGRLATITFGYYADGYEYPKIAQEIGSFETRLFDSRGSSIPCGNSTMLTLTIIGN